MILPKSSRPAWVQIARTPLVPLILLSAESKGSGKLATSVVASWRQYTATESHPGNCTDTVISIRPIKLTVCCSVCEIFGKPDHGVREWLRNQGLTGSELRAVAVKFHKKKPSRKNLQVWSRHQVAYSRWIISVSL